MSRLLLVTLVAGLVAIGHVAGQSSGACSSSSVSNSGSAIFGSSAVPVLGSGGSQLSGFCECVGKKDAAYLRLFYSAQSAFAVASPAFSITCAKPKKLCICPPTGKCFKAKKVSSLNVYSSCSGSSCGLYGAPVCSSSSKKAGFKAKKNKVTCNSVATATSVTSLVSIGSVSCAGCGSAKKMIKSSSSCTLQFSYFPPISGNSSGGGNSSSSTPPPRNGTGPTSPPPLNGTGPTSPPPPPLNGTTVGIIGGGSTVSGGGSTVSGGASLGTTGAAGGNSTGGTGGSTAAGASTAGATTTTVAPTTTTTVAAG